MKTVPLYTVFIILILFLVSITNVVNAQSKRQVKAQEKTAEIKKILGLKRFAFKAQSAQPMTGGNINLTSEYDLIVKKDTLISYLPYFGRAFVAPINPTESGIMFTTSGVDYTVENKKKGNKIITIILKDQAAYARQMILTVSELGYATLQVLSTNRQPISFTGYITAVK